MKSFGESVRKLRLEKGLLLREVAAQLQIDPSLLSRIERGNKSPTRSHVIQLAVILGASEKELLIDYLSDRLLYELQGEELAMIAVDAAEKKISYLLSHSRSSDHSSNKKKNSRN
jgi:transcriptional regulator with XRE-family HTH domain